MMTGLIVDNFAGGGGASLGIEIATGRPVDIAVNHDAGAIEMHAANHPHTLHLREDVFKVEPRQVCGGRPVGIAWFSPDCRHHSKSRGARPVSKSVRGLAWIALRWAAETNPRLIVLENVEEFAQWGPLTRKRGRKRHPRPCRFRIGQTFRRWKSQLESLGYTTEHRELVAADYGVPTTRKRLFIVARNDGESIHWPEQTHWPWHHVPHGKPMQRMAASIIDWSIPMRTIDGLCAKTRARIERELALHDHQPYIMSYYGNGGSRSVYTHPLATITTRDRFALICYRDGAPRFRMLQPRELARGQGFPDSYLLTGTRRNQVARIGNSVCPPLAAAIIRANAPWACREEAVA
jgi:DNA (cytosine-5)-methyltransferase 1